jgi:hypothetical protein
MRTSPRWESVPSGPQVWTGRFASPVPHGQLCARMLHDNVMPWSVCHFDSSMVAWLHGAMRVALHDAQQAHSSRTSVTVMASMPAAQRMQHEHRRTYAPQVARIPGRLAVWLFSPRRSSTGCQLRSGRLWRKPHGDGLAPHLQQRRCQRLARGPSSARTRPLCARSLTHAGGMANCCQAGAGKRPRPTTCMAPEVGLLLRDRRF